MTFILDRVRIGKKSHVIGQHMFNNIDISYALNTREL